MIVPVAAVAETVATSAASFNTIANVLDVPSKVLVPEMVCTVLVLATLVNVLLPNAMVLLVRVCEVLILATSVNVLLPNAMVLFVTVFVLVAVRTLVGVMIPDNVAIISL